MNRNTTTTTIRHSFMRRAAGWACLALLLLPLTRVFGDDRWWDGGAVNIGANGNGASGGTAGTWDTTIKNWDQGNALPHTNWVNANVDTANFGGTGGNIALNANVTINQIKFTSTAYNVGQSGTGTLTFGGSYSPTTPSIDTSFGVNSTAFGGKITGTISGGLVIKDGCDITIPGSGNGNGRVYLSNTGNDFVGDITLVSGNLTIAVVNFGDPANRLILAGGAIYNNSGVTATYPLTRNISVTANSGIGTAGTSPQVQTINLSGTIIGSGNLTHYQGTANSIINLQGDMSGYTGTFENRGTGGNSVVNIQTTATSGGAWKLTGGIVRLATSADDAAIINGLGKSDLLMNGGTLDMNGKSETINGLSGATGTVSNGLSSTTSTLTLGDGDATAIFAGSVKNGAGTVAVTKIGAGTQTLAGAGNTYTGGTAVSGGTLSLSNCTAFASAVTVTSPGVLELTNVSGAWTFGQAVSGTGSLRKSGAGSVYLSATTGYSGATEVKAGTLSLLSANTGTGAITVRDGATFMVTDAGIPLAPTSLTLGDVTGASAGFSNIASTATAPVNAGTLTLNGANTINIASGTFSGGSAYPLISYTTSTGFGSVSTGTYPALPSGTIGYVTNNASASRIEFVVTAPAVNRTWAGTVNGNWDTSTLNWDGGAASYADGNSVWFDDTATSYSVTNLVSPSASPLSMVVSNTTTYTISGNPITGASGSLTKANNGTLILANTNAYGGGTTVSGGTLKFGDGSSRNGVVAGNITDNAMVEFANPASQAYSGVISGTGALSKSAAGTLILNNTNSYGGGTTISGGTLQLGNGTTANGVVTGAITNNAALAIANPNAQTVANVISGSGAVAKSGSGTLTLSGNNTYTGATTISNGRVDISNSGALGTANAGTTVSSGAELHVAGNLVIAEPLSLSGSGGGNGAFSVDSGGSTWSGAVTLTGNALLSIADNVNMTLTGGIDGGGNALVFKPTTTSAAGVFTVSSPITNVSTLVMSNTVNMGGLLLNATNDSVTNVLVCGPVSTNSALLSYNGLWVVNSHSLGTNTAVTLVNSNSIGGFGARMILNGGVNIPAGVSVEMHAPGDGDAGPGTYRASLYSYATFSNVWNGPVNLRGSETAGISSLLQLYCQSQNVIYNGPFSFVAGTGELLLRGAAGTGTLNGTINLGANTLRRADSATWVIGSTGNTWHEVYWAYGTFRIAANDAFCTSAPVRQDFIASTSGNPRPIFDLNGFNQQVAGLYNGGSGSAYVPAIVNASTNTASTLTVSSALGSNWVYAGVLENVSGAKALNLVVAGTDPLTLTAYNNTYTGSTIVRSNATLVLYNAGYISGSTPIDVQAGGVFDVSGTASGGYSMSGGQTLMGNGTVNGSVWTFPGSVLSPGASIGVLTITNNLTIKGDLLFEVNKSLSPAASNDVILVGGVITNTGTGTLTVSNLNLSAPLAPGDKFTLFGGNVVGNGSALNIAPAPGSGLAWANKLEVDGSVEVVQSVATIPTNIVFSVTGGQMHLAWPPNYIGWLLQSNAVSVANTNFWSTVPGSDATNEFLLPIDQTQTNVFYRMLRP
jgi:fibronectin-binding autotransporter adhesin